MVTNIPPAKDWPWGAGQCDACGGTGGIPLQEECRVCGGKGWLPSRHPGIRKCENPLCSKDLPPDQAAVYCSNRCALDDF